MSASGEDRTARGAWYTPRPVAEAVAAMAFGSTPGRAWVPSFVVDPTCGGGALLLASLDRLVAAGLSAATALDRVAGIDVDEGAVATARRALDAWADGHGVSNRARLVVGDALGSWPATWPVPDLIIGNPPFATPLRGAALPPAAHQLRLDHAHVLGPYADLAAVHLVDALARVGPQGRVALILPQSLLAGRDVAKLREVIDRDSPPQRIWCTSELVFDANVRVWAPLFKVGGPAPKESWAEMVAGALGAPSVQLDDDAGTLADLATATAGFRDEYYGLVDACAEAEVEGADGCREAARGRLRLATVGSIDPLWSHWGERPTTFAKTRWLRPVVDPERVPDSLHGWLERERRPKVLVPTQSRVFEPFVDRDGSMVPVTPLISIHADEPDLDRIAAVLLAPPVAAWAHRRWFGTALSVKATKLAAKDVLTLPLPRHADAWSQAAALVGRGPDALHEIGRLMTSAYDADPGLFDWWADRLPARSR